MAKIWIVEDDPKIGLLIEMTVKKAEHVPRRLDDAVQLDEALDRGEELPDLLLLDIMLRAKSGYEVLKEWKDRPRTREIPVIIISARSAERDKVRGLELGAEDYITKPFGVLELQARIRTALRRVKPKDEVLFLRGLCLDKRTKTVLVDQKPSELSPMEYDLLLYLLEHADRAVTRQELIREVWGYATQEDSSRTVDVHIKTLRTKLGDKAEKARFIKTVRGTGYRVVTEEEA